MAQNYFNFLHIPRPATCQICTKETRLVRDHDHLTKKPRGWICRNCNLGLSNFEDSPDALQKAADYLKQM